MYGHPEIDKYLNISEVKDLEVVNLGTGFGYYDFIYDNLDVKAFNFALTQQTLLDDFLILNNYSSKLKSRCKVLIVLPVFILLADKKSFLNIAERYYSVLPEEVVKKYTEKSYSDYLKNETSEYEKKYLKLMERSKEEIEEESEWAVKSWIKQLGIISFGSGEMTKELESVIEENKKVLYDMILFCKANNFEPIIVVPPMCSILTDRIGENFLETHFYNPLKKVVTSDIVILDYLKDEKYVNWNMYGWPGFLLEDSAKIFTRDVLRRIGIDME